MSVLIATPCYGGWLHVGLFQSLVGIADQCARDSVPLNFLVTAGESAITRGRSNLAATFLRTDYQTLAMLDADIEIAPADFMRLLRLEKPVRGAAVALKTADRSESLSCWRDGKQLKREAMPHEPFEVDYLGGAVMLIERPVIERLSQIAMMQYEDPINGPGAHIFWERLVDRTLLSEDYAFCSLAREHGFGVWCDPAVIVNHYGSGVWRA